MQESKLSLHSLLNKETLNVSVVSDLIACSTAAYFHVVSYPGSPSPFFIYMRANILH